MFTHKPDSAHLHIGPPNHSSSLPKRLASMFLRRTVKALHDLMSGSQTQGALKLLECYFETWVSRPYPQGFSFRRLRWSQRSRRDKRSLLEHVVL